MSNVKVSLRQWREIDARIAKGDSVRSVAKDYPITEGAIRCRAKKGSAAPNPKKTTAAEVSAAIVAHVERMPAAQEDMEAIRSSLISAARSSAATAQKLAAIAAKQVELVDKIDPMNTAEVLQGIGALTKLSNDAGAVGMAFLSAERKAAVSEKTGKKEQQDDAAKKAAGGKYGVRQGPRLVASK